MRAPQRSLIVTKSANLYNFIIVNKLNLFFSLPFAKKPVLRRVKIRKKLNNLFLPQFNIIHSTPERTSWCCCFLCRFSSLMAPAMIFQLKWNVICIYREYVLISLVFANKVLSCDLKKVQAPLNKLTFNDPGRLIIICCEQLVNRSFYLHRSSTDVCS